MKRSGRPGSWNALADSTKPAVGPNYITTTVYMTQVCEFLKDLSIYQTFRLSVCSSVCLSLTKLHFSAFIVAMHCQIDPANEAVQQTAKPASKALTDPWPRAVYFKRNCLFVCQTINPFKYWQRSEDIWPYYSYFCSAKTNRQTRQKWRFTESTEQSGSEKLCVNC